MSPRVCSNSRGLVSKIETIKDRIDANGALANNAFGKQNIFFPNVRFAAVLAPKNA